MNTKRIMKSALLFTLTAGFMMVSSFATNVFAADVIKWKAHAHYPTSSPSYQDSVLVVADMIKERTGGRLVIEAYPANSLVPSKEIFNAVKRGMVQMGITAASYFRAQIPAVGVAAGLPYTFKTYAQAAYFMKSVGYEKMIQDIALDKHGLLFFIDRVYPTELVTKNPIRSLADFKGLKLRSSGVIQKYLTSLGGAAGYISGAEVYTSLSTGVVDGAHWGAAQGASKMNFYDMCKYHLRPPLTIAATDTWLINQKAFNKLPKDIQGIVRQVMEEHFWQRSNQYEHQEAVTLAKVQNSKGVTVVTLPQADQVKMTQIAEKLWDEEAKANAEYAKAINMMKDYLKKIGAL